MSKPNKYVNKTGWVTAGTKLNKPIPYNQNQKIHI